MNSNPWKTLYNEQSEEYAWMVQHEDYEHNLLPALNEIHPLENANVVDFGAGTGRITAQLVPLVKNVWAFDITPPMVQVASKKLKQLDQSNWLVGVGDSRAIPVPAACADIAVEGWSIVQIMAWHMDTWREDVGQAIDEMMRVVRPGGAVILIETLGTGVTTPEPPERFVPVYDYFERERGFLSTWIRTDFCFASLAQARDVLEPLFGDAVEGKMIETDEGIVVPECTGIWWRSV
ncbi:MAG: class I SAM-dependent methyltransferase [Chloroflexi bacterium]|nr:class I SAM-dependent methyltransferase [Chloroflexota bacterium]